jgi:hypothetical protein
MNILEIIDKLRMAKMRVTIYDMGRSNYVVFVLGVVMDEPIDIWYVAKALDRLELTPIFNGSMLYFPELKLDEEHYKYICNAY